MIDRLKWQWLVVPASLAGLAPIPQRHAEQQHNQHYDDDGRGVACVVTCARVGLWGGFHYDDDGPRSCWCRHLCSRWIVGGFGRIGWNFGRDGSGGLGGGRSRGRNFGGDRGSRVGGGRRIGWYFGRGGRWTQTRRGGRRSSGVRPRGRRGGRRDRGLRRRVALERELAARGPAAVDAAAGVSRPAATGKPVPGGRVAVAAVGRAEDGRASHP